MDSATFTGIIEWGGALTVCLNLTRWAIITILKTGTR